VRVLREVLDEAPGISDHQCTRLGIEIVRLETELMLEANNLPRSLSVTDRLCVVACDHYTWTLVTNDQALRNVCKDRGIHLRWGLGLMVDLVPYLPQVRIRLWRPEVSTNPAGLIDLATVS
jgi:hypothetical protein